MSNWASKQLSANEAVAKIHAGAHIFVGNGAATPNALIETMCEPRHGLVDMEIIQFFNLHLQPLLAQSDSRFRINSFFIDDQLFQFIRDGFGDYTPISLFSIPKLIQQQRLKVDVAIVRVTPPDENGSCSLGVGVDLSLDAMRSAKMVIAEVTEHMPWTAGNSLISVDQVHHWVPMDTPLNTLPVQQNKDNPIMRALASHIAGFIPDYATLRFGIGELAHFVLPLLEHHKGLGWHGEVMIEPIMQLMQKGVINNARKHFNKGKTIVSHAFGSNELYKFVDRNPAVEFHPLSYINNWANIGRNRNMTSVSQAFEIDLTGQVCSESRGHEFYGGFGGTCDFTRGSFLSEGGRSIVALRSTKEGTKESSIVPFLSRGSGVVISRADVQHVVTEYGVAYLHGKTIRERCLALIDIAHPNHREELLMAAKRYNYISANLPGISFKSRYPREWESVFTTKSGKVVAIRPVKPIDEGQVRDFFHALSDRSIYLRYFRQLRSLPHQVLHGMVDIDYSHNMTLIVLYTQGTQQEIVGMGQWVEDPQDDVPELAFQVSDSWQGQGLGHLLLARLIQIGLSLHISTFKADVLAENVGMLKVFESCGYPLQKKQDFGVVSLKINIGPIPEDTKKESTENLQPILAESTADGLTKEE